MFARELKRGKSTTSSKSQEDLSPQSRNNSLEPDNYCFDGENLILTYLTYQYIDLTYPPLRDIVNYPINIRSSVSVLLR